MVVVLLLSLQNDVVVTDVEVVLEVAEVDGGACLELPVNVANRQDVSLQVLFVFEDTCVLEDH